MLTDAQLKDAYTRAFAKPLWAEWQERFGSFLTEMQKLSPTELAKPENQEKVWGARAITGVGPGESVNVKDLFADKEIVPEIVALKAKDFGTDPNQRAAAFDAEFDRVLELVSKKTSRRPYARLLRLFASLHPGDFHTAMSSGTTFAIAKRVLGQTRDLSTVQAHVLVRARLRKVLGPESGIAEQVKRAVFCWWLYEDGEGKHAEPGSAKEPAEANEAKKVAVWSYHRQNKGLSILGRPVDAFRDLVQAALEGATSSDLIGALEAHPAFESMGRASLRLHLTSLKKLGLLELRPDGQLHPTRDGEAFLEPDGEEILAERMLERIFPFAHLIRHLKSGPHTAAEILAHLRTLYPNWTSDMAGNQLFRWAAALKLIEKDPKGAWKLSEEGAYWERALPDKLPDRGEVSSEPAEAAELSGAPSPETSPARPWPDLKAIAVQIQKIASELVIDSSQLAALHGALHCSEHKRFVILSGLSGTGKTQVMLAYAKAYLAELGVPEQEHLALVPVQPDWRDPSGLLGYLNELRDDPSFQPGPGLELLLRAAQNPHLPYFLVLDEMNLARVELYFAPFLSAMEVGKKGEIRLHSRKGRVDGVPDRVAWPTNLFVAGTVNMDETTHAFSDKVLDRAFTLEFWDVNLPRYFEARNKTTRDLALESVVLGLYQALYPVRRHFGYRTAGELLSFVESLGPGSSEADRRNLLDMGVFSKVLPKIRGEESESLRRALSELAHVCSAQKLERSTRKVKEMGELLGRTGITKFWG